MTKHRSNSDDYRRCRSQSVKYPRKRFGRLLRRLLTLCGKTANEVGEAIKSPASVYRWVEGQSLPLHDTEEDIRALVECLGLEGDHKTRAIALLSAAAEKDYHDYLLAHRPLFPPSDV